MRVRVDPCLRDSDHVQARACYSAPVSPAGSWDRKPVGGVWDLEDDLDLDSELGCYEDPSYFQHASPSGTPRKAIALPAPRFHLSPGEIARVTTATMNTSCTKQTLSRAIRSTALCSRPAIGVCKRSQQQKVFGASTSVHVRRSHNTTLSTSCPHTRGVQNVDRRSAWRCW